MSEPQKISLSSVFKLQSVREINKLDPYAVKLAQRWVAEKPAEARELESTGKLIATLKQQADEESLQQWRRQMRSAQRPDG